MAMNLEQMEALIKEQSKHSKETARLVEERSQKMQPFLSGLGPMVQGAVLADLVALWLAGHMGEDAEQYRELLIAHFLEHVRKLIPVAEKQILSRTLVEGRA